MGQYLQVLMSVFMWLGRLSVAFRLSVVGCGGATPLYPVLSFWMSHAGVIEVIFH